MYLLYKFLFAFVLCPAYQCSLVPIVVALLTFGVFNGCFGNPAPQQPLPTQQQQQLFIAVTRIPLFTSAAHPNELTARFSTCQVVPIDSIVSIQTPFSVGCPTDAWTGTQTPYRFLAWKGLDRLPFPSSSVAPNGVFRNSSMATLFKCLALFPAEFCALGSIGLRTGVVSPCPGIQINLFESIVRPNESERCVDWFAPREGTASPHCRIDLQLNMAYSSLCPGLIRVKQSSIMTDPDISLFAIGSNIELFTPFSTVILRLEPKSGGTVVSADSGFPLPWWGSALELNTLLPLAYFQPNLNWTKTSTGTLIRITLQAGAKTITANFTVFPGALSAYYVLITPATLASFNTTRFLTAFVNIVPGLSSVSDNMRVTALRPFVMDTQISKVPSMIKTGSSPTFVEVALRFLMPSASAFTQLTKNMNALVAKNTTLYPQGSVYVAANSSARCGTGSRYPTFACDDGNTKNNDGCSSTCTVEPGWICYGRVLQRSICTNKTTWTATPTATQTVTLTPVKLKTVVPNQNNTSSGSSGDDKTMPIAVGIAVPLGVLFLVGLGLLSLRCYRRYRNRVSGAEGTGDHIEARIFNPLTLIMPGSPTPTTPSEQDRKNASAKLNRGGKKHRNRPSSEE